MTIRFVTRPVNNTLGGFGPQNIDFRQFRHASILGRMALISKVEDGIMPFSGAGQDPSEDYIYQIPVLFQRNAGEVNPPSWPMADEEGKYVLLFSTNDWNKTFNLDIAIYSNELTKANIEGKKINKAMMDEIYAIIASTRPAF